MLCVTHLQIDCIRTVFILLSVAIHSDEDFMSSLAWPDFTSVSGHLLCITVWSEVCRYNIKLLSVKFIILLHSSNMLVFCCKVVQRSIIFIVKFLMKLWIFDISSLKPVNIKMSHFYDSSIMKYFLRNLWHSTQPFVEPYAHFSWINYPRMTSMKNVAELLPFFRQAETHYSIVNFN